MNMCNTQSGSVENMSYIKKDEYIKKKTQNLWLLIRGSWWGVYHYSINKGNSHYMPRYC